MFCLSLLFGRFSKPHYSFPIFKECQPDYAKFLCFVTIHKRAFVERYKLFYTVWVTISAENTQNAIAYYRVSTAKQGESRLGLDAQRAAVKKYAERSDLNIITEFTEIETGTSKRSRPEIGKAIESAKERGAVLLIAKLDRLARNVHFISGLMESNIQFVAVDMPTVTNLTLHILAAVAEEEAKMISKRTKAALAATKERGTKLGTPENLTYADRVKGAQTRRAEAIRKNKQAAAYAKLLRDSDSKENTYRAIAAKLNINGYRTTQGKFFKAMTVKRMLDRIERTSHDAGPDRDFGTLDATGRYDTRPT